MIDGEWDVSKHIYQPKDDARCRARVCVSVENLEPHGDIFLLGRISLRFAMFPASLSIIMYVFC